MFTAARWRLLVSTLPWVAVLLVVTWLRDDVLGIDSLVRFSDLGAILTGAALTDTTAIIFDVPGVGGSPVPTLPYRPSGLARLAAGIAAELGYHLTGEYPVI